MYAAEYAHQSDASENPFSYNEDYFLLEGGMKWNTATFIKSLSLKLSYEHLGGSGSPGESFVTILGTNHAFQGWGDRFLVTPNAGIDDFYLTTVMPLQWDMKFVGAYHHLMSDSGDFDYGDEIDVMLTKKFRSNYLLGIKAAFYDADTSSANATGGPSADATKVWVWLAFTFK